MKRPYIPVGCDQQSRVTPSILVIDRMQEEFDKHDPAPTNPVIDFIAACVLAAAMTLMEEPDQQKAEAIPATPWRQLSFGVAVVGGALFGLWFSLQMFPVLEQVASR